MFVEMSSENIQKRKFGLSLVLKKWNKYFYRNPKGVVDPDSQWRQQNEQKESNEAYQMVSFDGKGRFLEEYNKGKKEEERKHKFLEYFAINVAPQCLYTNVEMVSKDDYQKWHKEQQSMAHDLKEKEMHSHRKRLTNPRHIFRRNAVEENTDKASIFSLDAVVEPYEEHEVKWKLEKRGAIGETPLHLLFLNGTETHIKIAAILLEKYPELAIDLYEGYEYYGESCLHFAIIQNNLEAVKILLKTRHVDLHARARGKFFVPVDIKRGDVKLRKQKFEGYAYYGEYPLSFAASIGNRTIYDELIAAGCDPEKRDKYGNGVLHLTVIHNQPEMYYYIVKHSKPPRLDICNNNNLTPLALAAKLGKKEMFRKILEISARHYWSYNTVSCSAYPLKSLDTIGPTGETDWNSALMMIIRGRKDNHLDLVSDGVVHQLLEEKWNKFGRDKFARLLIIYIFHVLFLSIAIYLRPSAQRDLRFGVSSGDIARYVFEALVIVICSGVLFYAVREIYLESLKGYVQNLISIPSRVFYVVSSVLVIVCIPMRFIELYNVEEWLLVFSVPGLWSYLLFFLRNWSITGPFITMIFRIFATDMVRFAVIYVIILFTCSIAFFYQYEGQGVEAFLTEQGTFMTLFQMSFGEFDYPTILQGKYPAITIIMFVAFMIIAHILLLNMLIAMITRTFEKIQKKSEKVWRRQWASMVVTMERSHSAETKLLFQSSYDIDIQANRVTKDGDASNTEHSTELLKPDNRALMVVHHRKTSESQRKQQTKSRWKKVSQRAILEHKTPTTSPSPKLQIKSLTGLSDFIQNAPQQEGETSTFLERIQSLRSHTPNVINYSDSEEEEGD